MSVSSTGTSVSLTTARTVTTSNRNPRTHEGPSTIPSPTTGPLPILIIVPVTERECEYVGIVLVPLSVAGPGPGGSALFPAGPGDMTAMMGTAPTVRVIRLPGRTSRVRKTNVPWEALFTTWKRVILVLVQDGNW